MTKEVGNIIYQQLGGGRFTAMTGTKGFVWDGENNTLRMTLARNASKANKLYITYNADDTYTMRFFKYTAPRFNSKTLSFTEEKTAEVRTYEHIFCDQLQELFTEATGMYTRL